MNKTKSELAYFILTLIKDAELVRDAQLRIGADDAGHTCPSCNGLRIIRNDDGLGSKVCPACNGTGQI